MQKIVYNVLWVLFRIILRLFYRRMTVRGREHGRLRGPFIVISNHPNTLMDALIVGTRLRQRIGFLGNASLFRNPKMAAVLRFLGVIPIYRQQDLLPGETMANNEDAFRKAYAHLAAKGAFLVFPEGTSIAERTLRELRTGTARIALGYEAQQDFKGGLRILPVSINYSASTHWRTRVHVNLNAPLNVSEYAEAYAEDPYKAARSLTSALTASLADGLVILDDKEQERMFQQMVRLHREHLEGPNDLRAPSRKGFAQEKATAEALRALKAGDPDRYTSLRDDLDRYFGLVDRLGLRQSLFGDRTVRWHPALLALVSALLMLLGLPFFLVGAAAAFIPYHVAGWLPPRIARDIEYRAPIMMMAGMFLFPLFYGLEALAFGLLAPDNWPGWLPWSLLLALPVCGWLALLWLDNAERLYALVRLLAMGGRRGNAGKRLRAYRAAILSEAGALAAKPDA